MKKGGDMNYFISIFFVASVLVSALHAEPDIVDLKDTSSILKMEYQDLSPAYGCLWFKEPILYNMFRLRMIKNDPINALVKRLFFLNYDLVNFNAQPNPQRLEAHITANIIGSMVGLIRKHQNLLEEEIKNNLETAISKSLQELEKKGNKNLETDEAKAKIKGQIRISHLNTYKKNVSSKLKVELEKLLKNNDELSTRFRAALQEAATNIQDKISDTDDNIESLKTSKNPEKDTMIDQLEETRKKLQTKYLDLEKSLNKDWKNSYGGHCSRLVDSTVAAFKVCDNESYLDTTLINILLGFAWAKSFSRKDLRDYFAALYSVLNENAFSDISFLDNENWLTTKFTEKDYLDFKVNFENDPVNFIKNVEQSVFFYYGYRRFVVKLPEKIRYSNDAKYLGKIFPDCGETTLRNAFNIIAYDPDTGTFSHERLVKLNITHDKLLAFYEKYYQPISQQYPQAHNDFAAIVSNLSDIIYVHTDPKSDLNYEIGTDNDGQKAAINFNKLIAHFTGQTSLQDLFALAKKNLGIESSFKSVDYKKDSKVADIAMTIRNYEYNWHFSPKHIDLEVPSLHQSWPTHITPKSLKEDNATLTWLSLFSDTIDQASPAQLFHYYVCKNLRDLSVAKNIFRNIVTNPQFNLFISDLYFYFPSRDAFAKKTFFDAVPSGSISDVVSAIVASDYLANDQLAQSNIIQLIINKKYADKFETFINKTMPGIENETNKWNIIKLMIKDNIADKFNNAISQALSTLKTDRFKCEIVEALVDKNLTEKFESTIDATIRGITDDMSKPDIIETMVINGIGIKFKPALEKLLSTMDETEANDYRGRLGF